MRNKTCLYRVIEIRRIGKPVIALGGCELGAPEAAIVDVALQLLGIGFATEGLLPLCPPPASEWTLFGTARVLGEILRVTAGETRAAIGFGHPRQTQLCAQREQHILEGADVSIGGDDRLSNGVGCAIRIRNGTVEQRDSVPAFKVGGVRQN